MNFLGEMNHCRQRKGEREPSVCLERLLGLWGQITFKEQLRRGDALSARLLLKERPAGTEEGGWSAATGVDSRLGRILWVTSR